MAAPIDSMTAAITRASVDHQRVVVVALVCRLSGATQPLPVGVAWSIGLSVGIGDEDAQITPSLQHWGTSDTDNSVRCLLQTRCELG